MMRQKSLLPLLIALISAGAFAQSVGKFVPTSPMVTPRIEQSVISLNDGRVLFAGGESCPGGKGCKALSSLEIFDPSTGQFTAAGNMVAAGGPIEVLSDGRVLFMGGGISNAQFYDPATSIFSPASLMYPFSELGTLQPDGTVLIKYGGSASLFDPSTGSFLGSGLLLNDGRILNSNVNADGSRATITLKIANHGLQQIAGFDINAYAPSMTLLASGDVLIAGGECLNLPPYCKATDEAFLFDPRENALKPSGLLALPRDHPATVTLSGGHGLIIGGYGPDYDSATPCGTGAEEYNPATGSFEFAGADLFRFGCNESANLLPDGRVLVTIVNPGSGFDPGVEIYVPRVRAASAASMEGPLAPASIGSIFGSQLAAATASADATNLQTRLGGIGLNIHDSSGAVTPAPLFLASPTEIRFEVPPGIAPGEITLELIGSPVPHDRVAAHVNKVAPGIFTFSDNMVAGLIQSSLLSPPGTIVVDGSPVEITVFATGIRNRSSLANVLATLGGAAVTVASAEPDPDGTPGLDQVKITLPADFKARGYQDLVMTVDGVPSNATSVQILGGRDASVTSTPRTPPRTR